VASLRRMSYIASQAAAQRRRSSFVMGERMKAAVSLLFSSLSGWDQSRKLFLGYSPIAAAEVVVRTDASTDFGAGGFAWPSFDGFIHRWSAADRTSALASSTCNERESTMFFELRAIRLALDVFGPSLRGKRVQFESDSQCGIQALQTTFSHRPLCQNIIQEIISICVSLHIFPRWEHISACFNKIADCLSHNRLSQAQEHCATEFQAMVSVVSCQQ
jgi:hypothetical protein